MQPPVGFWDPLGFTKTDDAASFRRRRYVELKHGRVAMFACLGYIVPEYYRWPGEGDYRETKTNISNYSQIVETV